MKKIFSPQEYKIEDVSQRPFIDMQEIDQMLSAITSVDDDTLDKVLKKSFSKQRLSLQDTAILIAANTPTQREKIKQSAKELKRLIYGNRIVVFAPLYIGNRCTNNCLYCGFREDNKEARRKTLNKEEIGRETQALVSCGHKRLILVFGEHPVYSAQFIADTVREVYKNQDIRRVNINAAPFDIEGFATIKESGIGTFQIFQETYDPQIYNKFHLSGKKSDYNYRLTALDRAMEAGIDDVGIGVLLGLGDWRREVMALIRHTNHLEACFGVGPHTISFPRIKEAQGVDSNMFQQVNDDDFIHLISIIRLAVPYTGLILTARESQQLRTEAMKYGVSQIDGGTKIGVGDYWDNADKSDNLDKEQFSINDSRSLQEVIRNLVEDGYIPSFCTSCYRKGRTGEHFMEFSVSGFIKRFCTPNALITFAEYLEDYADDQLKTMGYSLIFSEIEKMSPSMAVMMKNSIERIKEKERDNYL